jgi:hypothetical protein
MERSPLFKKDWGMRNAIKYGNGVAIPPLDSRATRQQRLPLLGGEGRGEDGLLPFSPTIFGFWGENKTFNIQRPTFNSQGAFGGPYEPVLPRLVRASPDFKQKITKETKIAVCRFVRVVRIFRG